MIAAKSCHRDWGALTEALGVFLLIMLYIWWLRLYHPWLALVLLGFVIGTHFMHKENARWLGFGWRSFRVAAPVVLPWVAVAALLLLGIGVLLDSVRETTTRAAILSVFAYIVWGLFQQYLLNGFFVNRLAEYACDSEGHFVPLAAATLFALAHLPNWFLMPITFIGGYLAARVYLRFRNLYVLALAHGIIGFSLFLIVPDSISAHFLVGPRYLLHQYGMFPEFLL